MVSRERRIVVKNTSSGGNLRLSGAVLPKTVSWASY